MASEYDVIVNYRVSLPQGGIDIQSNGSYNVSGYATANVDVDNIVWIGSVWRFNEILDLTTNLNLSATKQFRHIIKGSAVEESSNFTFTIQANTRINANLDGNASDAVTIYDYQNDQWNEVMFGQRPYFTYITEPNNTEKEWIKENATRTLLLEEAEGDVDITNYDTLVANVSSSVNFENIPLVFNETIGTTADFEYEVNFTCPATTEFTAILMRDGQLYYRSFLGDDMVYDGLSWLIETYGETIRRPIFYGPTIPFDLAQYLINNSIIGIEGFNTLAITENGEYYATKYDKVSVNIPEKTPLIPYISPDAATSEYYFEYSSGDGYWYPNNGGVDSSISIAKVYFTGSDGTKTLYMDAKQSSEVNFDYGVVGGWNRTISPSTSATTSGILAHTKGLSGSQSYTIGTIPSGSNYIMIGYRKDSSTSSNSDYFAFKLRVE